MTNVSLRNLTKVYDGTVVPAVKSLNLEIKSGELVALLGPSGCGKTTTLKMIAGLHDVTSGDVFFDGMRVNRIKPEKREVVMVYQNYLLFPYMNVEQNIGFGLKMRHMDKDEIHKRVLEILSLVKLEGFEKRSPSQLSGGQKQRVALARALVIHPKILLLDEPLSNLDAHLRDEMREMILKIHRDFGLTTIFVTHDQEEAVVLADRIALMFDGLLQQYSPPKAFYETPQNTQISSFFGNTNFLQGIKKGSLVETEIGDFSIREDFNVNDGSVTLIVRPESIGLHKAEHNSFSTRISTKIYMGTYIRYRIDVNGSVWNVIGDAQEVSGYDEGEEMWFTLPKDKIWVLPQEAE